MSLRWCVGGIGLKRKYDPPGAQIPTYFLVLEQKLWRDQGASKSLLEEGGVGGEGGDVNGRRKVSIGSKGIQVFDYQAKGRFWKGGGTQKTQKRGPKTAVKWGWS